MTSSARWGAVALVLVAGACSHASPPPLPEAIASADTGHVGTPGCSTRSARIAFDFEGASQSRCVIESERAFSILVSPEHAPPINPSPWYAFRYSAEAGSDLSITLRYLSGEHRYRPKLEAGGEWQVLDAQEHDEGRSASFALPAGSGRVAGQEIFDPARHHALIATLAGSSNVERLALGLSHDGRPIEALRIGAPDAGRLVVLLGRAHPPEVTGALAMEVFLQRLVEAVDAGELEGVQILAVPLLNPDGIARGHWRANLGGTDLNRDWGTFAQPETRAVAAWLDALPASVRPVAMVDFHSTQRNLFYVQGESETDASQENFLASWLGGREQAIPGYPFTIERRNANPGSGTSKNWFHARYAIPAYTYEVGDETDREAIARAAEVLAASFAEALPEL